MDPLHIQTPAKVNLVLDVLARRADGYHEICSLMIAVGLYDRITLEPAPPGTIELTCDHPDVPTDEANLCHQAARRLGKRIGRIPGCRIHLEKRIPLGGGMGGGSGNAAGVLRGLNHLWNCGLDDAALMSIAGGIGSDVPFFFAGGSAIVTGRGDCVRPVPMSWRGWLALVIVGVHVSTPEVYAHCTPGGPESHHQELAGILNADNATVLRDLMRNRLEPAVFAVAPEVLRARDTIADRTGRTLQVSGAGSVLFDVFDTEGDARRFTRELVEAGCSAVHLVVPAPVTGV